MRSPAIGVETVDVTLWNLDVETWRSVTRHDNIDIEMGWNNAFTTTVSRSVVVTKRRRGSGADRAFILRGVGRNGQMLKRREYSGSFNNLPPHQIIELVAKDLGLGIGYISRSSDPLDGYYALSKRKTVREWFNRLADIAAEQTDRRWVWYVEQGELYFHPAGEQTAKPVELGIGKSVIRATPVGQTASRDDHPYEIVMRCEPSLRRGMTVTVSGVDNISPARRYRVQSLVHNSSTTEGSHHTTVVVTPIVASEAIYGQSV